MHTRHTLPRQWVWLRKINVSSPHVCKYEYNNYTFSALYIRESVDSLYRDDTGEISRDPRTKRLKTRRESLPRPSKYASNSLRAHIYLYMFPKISYAPSVVHASIRDFTIFVSSYSSSSFFSSSSSLNPLSPYQYQFKR